MSKFVPTIEFKTTFDGDEITLTIKPMLNEHLVKLLPYFQPRPELGTVFARTARLMAEQREPLEQCLTDLKGLVDANGVAIELPQAMKQTYFLPLFDQVVAELVRVSLLTSDDAKKSAPPPLAAS